LGGRGEGKRCLQGQGVEGGKEGVDCECNGFEVMGGGKWGCGGGTVGVYFLFVRLFFFGFIFVFFVFFFFFFILLFFFFFF